MKSALFSLVVAAILCASALAECGVVPKTGSFLSYVIEPKVNEGVVSLEVTLSFRLEGKTADLILPSEWQGQKELYRAINSLEAVSPGTVLLDGKQPWERRLTFPPGRVATLRYRVSKDWSGQIDASSSFRVMLGPDYFQVTGHNFLVYPKLPEETELPIFLEWKSFPADWSAVSSLSGDSRCTARTRRLIKLSNGLFAGGLLRIAKVMVASKPVFVVMRGRWDFADNTFSDMVQRIVGAERGFWQDTGIPNYVVTLAPSDDAPGNYGGTALEDSFALFMGAAAHLDFQTKFLFAHEIFHGWNAGRLGEIKQEQPFWFTEGFTDYYARVLLLRAGLTTASEYSGDVDAAYREYLASAKIHAKGKVVEESFFTDVDEQRLAYLRGDLLALRWDQIIRRRTHDKKSLDDAMLALLHLAAQDELVLTDKFLAGHFGVYVGPDAQHDVVTFIEDGETIPLESSVAHASNAAVH